MHTSPHTRKHYMPIYNFTVGTNQKIKNKQIKINKKKKKTNKQT